MGIFGNDPGFEEMLKRLHRMEQQAQQNSAAATAPAPAPAVICPGCKAEITIPPEHQGKPLWKLHCLGCKRKLGKNPITVEFCIWLQNEWAEEIRSA